MKSSFRYIATSLVIGGVASVGIWHFQSSLIGSPPTTVFSPTQHAEQFEYQDPDIERLKEATKVRPKERTVWISLARELLEKAKDGVITRQQASFEAIDALRAALDLDPKDHEALLLMGDISFDMQAFTKALEFYEQYLAIRPEDDATRARYASTLTFVGRSDEAVEMLQGITARNPEAFQPHALLMLAYAQQGDREKMAEQGERALALAPNEEAKARLSALLSRPPEVKPGDAQSGPPRRNPQPQPESVKTQVAKSGQKPPSVVRLGKFLKDNPVAGPKIKGFKVEEQVFVVYVEQFPMSAMPPFAKEKFYGGIKAFIKEQEIKDITALRFVDRASGKEEAMLKLDS